MQASTPRHLTNSEVAQALKHPLRRKLVRAFGAVHPLSPKEASHQIGAPLSDVCYHVRVLVDFGFLALHSKEQVRGAQKNYYVPNREVLNSPKVEALLRRGPADAT